MLLPAAVAEEEDARFEREAGLIIEAMRQRASEIAREEVDRTMRRIGADAELEERLAAMAEALVSTLLRPASARLHQAGADGRSGERLVAAAVEMFGLAGQGEPAREREARRPPRGARGRAA